MYLQHKHKLDVASDIRQAKAQDMTDTSNPSTMALLDKQHPGSNPSAQQPKDNDSSSSTSNETDSPTPASARRKSSLTENTRAAIDKKYEAKKANADSKYHVRCDRLDQSYLGRDCPERRSKQEKMDQKHERRHEKIDVQHNKKLAHLEIKAKKTQEKESGKRRRSHASYPRPTGRPSYSPAVGGAAVMPMIFSSVGTSGGGVGGVCDGGGAAMASSGGCDGGGAAGACGGGGVC